MSRNTTTGVFTRVSNSFSQPVIGTLIDPVAATALFNDQDAGLNSLPQSFTANVSSPGSSAVYFHMPNPANGYTTILNGMTVQQGAVIPVTNQFAENTVGLQQTLVGTINIAAGDTAGLGIAGAFYATTHSTSGNATALFGYSFPSVAGSNVFALNGAIANYTSSASGGLDMNSMIACELDINLNQKIGGIEPVIGHIMGLRLVGAGNIAATPANSEAVSIGPLNILNGTPWAYGFRTDAAGAVDAVSAGPVGTGNSKNSQALAMVGTSSGGSPVIGRFFVDTIGSIYAVPASNTRVNLTDGNGNVLLTTGTGFGAALPYMTVAGIVTNNALGELITSPMLSAALGGTGQAAVAVGDLLYGSAVNTWSRLAKDTGGVRFLTNQGAAAVPAWSPLTATLATFFATPSSANLATAMTDETGSGLLVFNNTPTLITPIINGLPTGTGVATANTASTLVARDASGNFSAGTISAALSGNATTATSATSATSATNATNTAITDDTSTNATMNLTWVTSNTGNLPQKTTSTKLTFNPSTGALSSTSFVGAGTGLTGTASGLTSGDVANAPVIAKVLTGFTSGPGTVTAADSILSAFQKINGNDALKAPLASPALTGTPTAPTAAVDTNTMQIATQAAILQQASSATPLGNGTATAGSGTRFSRDNHVHPIDAHMGLTMASTASVNFNSANTDSGIVVPLPPGYTRVALFRAYISNASASLVGSTVGIYTTTGAGGTALITPATAVTVSTSADNTAGNTQSINLATAASQVSASLPTPGTIYFRIGTATVSPATADVTFFYVPLP